MMYISFSIVVFILCADIGNTKLRYNSTDVQSFWERAMYSIMERFFDTGELHILCQSTTLCFSDFFVRNFNGVVSSSGQNNHHARPKDNFFVVGSTWRAALTQLSLLHAKTDNRVVISWLKGNDEETDSKDIDELLQASWELLLVNVVVVLIPTVTNGTEIHLYSYFPFRNGSRCFDTSGVLVDVWSEGSFKSNTDLFQDKVKNLNKCPLRVTSFEDEPQTWLTFENGKDVVGGFASPLLSEVSLAMNFTIDARVPTDRAFWGSENSGMFGDLRQNRTDIGFAETPLKTKVVDVASCNVVSCVTWCIPTKYERQSAWEKLSREFSIVVWILLALSCAFVSCGIRFFSCLAPEETRDMTCVNAFSLTVSPLVGRAVKYLPISFTVRVFLAHWLMFSLVISGAYQAGLHTANTIPASSVQVETVRDLEKSDLKIVLIEDMLKLLIQSVIDNPELQVFLRRAKLYKDSIGNILEDMSRYGDSATLISQDYCRYFKKKHKSMGVHFPYQLHGFSTYCLASPAVGYFSLRHGSPLAPKIRKLEKRLSEVGLLNRWLNKISARKKRQEEKLQPLNLQAVEPAFVLLIGGAVFALCTFSGEILASWHIKKRLKAKENGELVPCITLYC